MITLSDGNLEVVRVAQGLLILNLLLDHVSVDILAVHEDSNSLVTVGTGQSDTTLTRNILNCEVLRDLVTDVNDILINLSVLQLVFLLCKTTVVSQEERDSRSFLDYLP